MRAIAGSGCKEMNKMSCLSSKILLAGERFKSVFRKLMDLRSYIA